MQTPRCARIRAEVFERYPDYRAHVVYARGFLNRKSDDQSLRLLRSSQEEARQVFGHASVAGHPHVAAWRKAYSRFGSKPSRYPCSLEALLRRALKDNLPRINWLVDVYNAVSLSYLLPIGGEDHDSVQGDPVLRLAAGGEVFETNEDGQRVVTAAEPGEVIWVDDGGVTCRRWNWRQCTRTALTDQSINSYFVLDTLDGYPDAQLNIATQALVTHLRLSSPDCDVETVAITRNSRDFGDLVNLPRQAPNISSLIREAVAIKGD